MSGDIGKVMVLDCYNSVVQHALAPKVPYKVKHFSFVRDFLPLLESILYSLPVSFGSIF